ncbi:hypothetical protein [Pseudomonas juntendi]|uniref:hypothetical protein n=1 Tax=Pseudomonas juntendi TaxID=2666183 RepID=UPI003209842E
MGILNLTKSSSDEPSRPLARGALQKRTSGIKLVRKIDWLALLLLTGQGMKPGTYVHCPGN